MSTSAGVRRLLLDAAPGERRGVVLLDGRPERLLIERDGEGPDARLGERLVGRVGARSGDRVFVELPVGSAGLMRLPDPPPCEGAAVEVEVAAEAYADKGPRLAWLRAGEGPPRPLAPSPPLLDRLRAVAPDTEVERGEAAREAADLAEDAALAATHRFRGGLTLTVEPTRALTAVDVDLATGDAAGARRVREANLSAVRHAVRLLRLKALGGVAAIDLLGFPPPDEGGLLRAEAGRALRPDGADASATAPDRYGLLRLARPRRERPAAEILLAADGRASARSVAQRLMREFLRAAHAAPGSLWIACAPQEVAAALEPLLPELGPRLRLREVAGDRLDAHIRRA